MSEARDLIISLLPWFQFAVRHSEPPGKSSTEVGRDWKTSKALLFFELFTLGENLPHLAATRDLADMLEKACELLEALVSDEITGTRSRQHKRSRLAWPKLRALRDKLEREDVDEFYNIGSAKHPWLQSAICLNVSWKHLEAFTGDLATVNSVLSRSKEDIDQIDRRTEQFGKTSSIMPRFQDLSVQLHEIFKKQWNCCCSSPHEVNLRLNSCGFNNVNSDIELEFFFYKGPVPTWQEGTIQLEQYPDRHMPSKNCGKEARVESRTAARPKRVHFQPVAALETFTSVITDLCPHLEMESHKRCCTYMKLDGNILYGLPSITKKHPSLLHKPAINLHELVQHQLKLTIVGKKLLALIVAQSILPLIGTPWLSTVSSQNDLFFAIQRNNKLSEPFITSTIGGNCTNVQQDHTSQHQCPELLALGIFLWEIELGKPIEELRTEEDLHEGQPTVNTDFGTALRLLEEHGEDLYPGYREAIEACLRPDFLPFTKDMLELDEATRQEMCDRIAKPLEDDLIGGFEKMIEKSRSGNLRTFNDLWRDSELQCWSTIQSKDIKERWSSTASKSRTAHTSSSSCNKTPANHASFNTDTRNVNLALERKLPQEHICQLYDDEEVDDTKIWNSNRWLRRMYDGFETRLGEPSEPRIKIALLDSGFDASHPFIRGASDRIIAHHCLHPNVSADEDIEGHGTHILALLLKYAPFADIYSVRISHTDAIDDDESIKQAIEWAVDKWHVDIISMSFGLRSRSARISNAIKMASNNNTILFAAASNGGGNDSRTYPASDSRVICIHSTDDKGNRSRFSPTAKRNCDNFAVLGENIKSSCPRTADSSAYSKVKSGTSFATPIAAAIAANVLEYGQQKLKALPDTLQFLRTTDGIRAILREMTEERDHPRDDYDYITPWKLFGNDMSDDDILAMIRVALAK